VPQMLRYSAVDPGLMCLELGNDVSRQFLSRRREVQAQGAPASLGTVDQLAFDESSDDRVEIGRPDRQQAAAFDLRDAWVTPNKHEDRSFENSDTERLEIVCKLGVSALGRAPEQIARIIEKRIVHRMLNSRRERA